MNPLQTNHSRKEDFPSLPLSSTRKATPSWSLKKWGFVVCTLFALQVLFFGLLLDKHKTTVRTPLTLQENQMLSQVTEASNPVLLSLIESFDPRAFSYAHPRGISAFLWRNKSLTEYDPAPLQAPLLGLTPGKEFFEQELSQLLTGATNKEGLSESIYPDNMKIREQSPRLPLESSKIKLDSETLLHWQAPALTLPTLSHPGSLRDTVLKATLGADGRIFSTTLLSSCGLASADQEAIAAVSALQLLPLHPTLSFDPAPSDTWSAPQSITLSVSWATKAPTSKNTPLK